MTSAVSDIPGSRTRPTDPFALAFREHPRAGGLLRTLPAGTRVLVAFSGGLDSLVLLHLLRFAPPRPDLVLTAAHFDHRMRPGSERMAAWVRGICRAWQIELVSAAAAEPLRGEAAARTARYRFLEQAAHRLNAQVILTAHQLDDQAETLLFRMARGTGLRGLAGIPARRGPLLRPLLPFRRAVLQAYARRMGLTWREDETNRSLRFTRNRIRALVLPRLEQAWPNAVARLEALALLAGEAEELWQEELQRLLPEVLTAARPDAFQLARGLLLEYRHPTRARVVRYLLAQLGAAPDRVGTRTVLAFIRTGESGTGVCLRGGVRVEREFDRIILRRPAGPSSGPVDRPIRILTPEGSGTGQLGGQPVQAHWGQLEHPASAAGAGPLEGWRASFDLSGLRFPLLLRPWRPGDRITLAYGTKKVKELLRERRIGRSARGSIAVLTEQDGSGRVLWVAGVARSAAVPERGRDTWQITVEHGDD